MPILEPILAGGSPGRRDDHKLGVGPVDILKRQCEELIASFDSRHLEPERLLWQRLRDAGKKLKKPEAKE